MLISYPLFHSSASEVEVKVPLLSREIQNTRKDGRDDSPGPYDSLNRVSHTVGRKQSQAFPFEVQMENFHLFLYIAVYIQ